MDCSISEKFVDFGCLRRQNIDWKKEAEDFRKQLDTATREKDIQDYIKNNKKWFIPASLFRAYDFGHHEAYLYCEPQLGSEYRADYLLLGKNSLGYHIVLVEFEGVDVAFKNQTSNSETPDVRKGLIQIRDWRAWIDNHRTYFLDSLGISNIDKKIPSWGFRYCLVVGRRNKMDEASNQLRRQLEKDNQIIIPTYDRLADYIACLYNVF